MMRKTCWACSQRIVGKPHTIVSRPADQPGARWSERVVCASCYETLYLGLNEEEA